MVLPAPEGSTALDGKKGGCDELSVEGGYFEMCGSMSSDQIAGMDGQEPGVIANAPFGAVTQPVRPGTSKDVSYRGHWHMSFPGTSSFITDFRYAG